MLNNGLHFTPSRFVPSNGFGIMGSANNSSVSKHAATNYESIQTVYLS